MIKTFKVSNIFLSSLLIFGILFSSCTPNLGSSGLRGRTTQNVSSASLALGQGFILADNPVILSGNANLDPNSDLNSLVSGAYITNKGFLTGAAPCDGLLPCFEVLATKTSLTALQTVDGKWGYAANTPEFLQTNTYFHMAKTTDLFFANLAASQTFTNRLGYDSAIPNTTLTFRTEPLHSYANCEVADNAGFDYAKFTLCFGYLAANSNVKFAQDSTIIYHEMGHFYQKLQLNFRNPVPVTGAMQADMGNVFYTEAGALGEGISDFYSYYVNGRSHLGEWAAGRILHASRPISEADALHAPGISTDPSQRLNYPTFLNYEPNNALVPIEDIHNAGMIISHYLVALSQDFQSYCLMPTQAANNMVTHLLNETLAELGDLTTKGTNGGAVGKINYKTTYAKDWFRVNNPINYRSFAQTFAKNLYQNMQTIASCNGAFYGKDRIETLLDDYGLLLFRTYNQNRNLADPATKMNITVAATNRRKSTLISKTLLKLDPTPGASAAFIIDAQNQIADGVASLASTGTILSDLSQTPSGFPFNNGNGRVSPGEVVGIGINLYNDSNSTMGGIQVLANDWNHVDMNPYKADGTTVNPNYRKPYIFDLWPLASEGGVPAPAAVQEQFSPVCLIQSKSADGSSTQWITQSEYRQKVALDKTMCLDNSNTATSDKDCFIRAVKGVEQAQYSKLAPKSNWGKTLMDPATQVAYGVGWSNLILFQVSKNVPPGTVVNCRLRARFTNCEECYHDANRSNYDYRDLDYNGAAPFKIINLQFSIID